MRKIKLKIGLFSLFIASVLLFGIMTVSAVNTMTSDNVSIQLPTLGQALNGNFTFNCSINNETALLGDNWTSATLWMGNSSTTANTTMVALLTVLNSTTAEQDFNGTLNSSVLEDGLDYSFKCQLWNGTLHINNTISNLLIDNGEPTIAANLTPSATNTDGTINFSADIIPGDTTACYLEFHNSGPTFGNKSQVMVNTTNSCSLVLTGMPAQSYNWFIRTSDGSNFTDTAIQTTAVQISTGTGGSLTQQQLDTALGGTGGILSGDVGGVPIAVIVAVLSIVGIVWWIRKS